MAIAPGWTPGFSRAGTAPPPPSFGRGRGRYASAPVADTPYTRVSKAVRAILGAGYDTPGADAGGRGGGLINPGERVPPPGGGGPPPPRQSPPPPPAGWGIWAGGDPRSWSTYIGENSALGGPPLGWGGMSDVQRMVPLQHDPSTGQGYIAPGTPGTISLEEARARMGGAGLPGGGRMKDISRGGGGGGLANPGYGYSTPGGGYGGGGYGGRDYSQGGGGGGFARPGAGYGGGGYDGQPRFGGQPNRLPPMPFRKNAYETWANFKAAQAGQPFPFPDSDEFPPAVVDWTPDDYAARPGPDIPFPYAEGTPVDEWA